MAGHRQARERGHQIEVAIDDQGEPSVTVDGETVPVRLVEGGKFAITYLPPHEDLLEAARQYVNHLPRK